MEEQISKTDGRRRVKQAAPYAFLPAVVGSVAVYFLADLVTAVLVFIAVAFATLSGLALGLRVSDWYADLMNKPWRRRD